MGRWNTAEYLGASSAADMFDCVMPTRNARNAQLFDQRRINLRNAKHRFDEEPPDAGLTNYASANFSRAYLRHLFIADEILALQTGFAA